MTADICDSAGRRNAVRLVHNHQNDVTAFVHPLSVQVKQGIRALAGAS